MVVSFYQVIPDKNVRNSSKNPSKSRVQLHAPLGVRLVFGAH